MHVHQKTQITQIAPVSLSEYLMYLTVRISSFNAKGEFLATGTGFYFLFGPEGHKGRGILVLVTNSHVLEKSEWHQGQRYVTDIAERIDFNIHVDGVDGRREPNFPVNLVLKSRRFDHPDPKVDLSIVYVGDAYDVLKTKGQTPFLKVFSEMDIESDAELAKLSGVNDAVIAGYPIDLFDNINNYPLFRKGITALHPVIDFEGLPHGLLDIACWPGSSGSPALILNEGIFTGKQYGQAYPGARRIFLGIVCSNYAYTIDSKVEKRQIATRRDISLQVPVHVALYIKAKALFAFRAALGLKDDMYVGAEHTSGAHSSGGA